MNRVWRAGSNLLMVLPCLVGVTPPASAHAVTREADVAGMRQFLSCHRVPGEAQNRLIADVLAGKQLDAGRDAKPIRVSESRRKAWW